MYTDNWYVLEVHFVERQAVIPTAAGYAGWCLSSNWIRTKDGWCEADNDDPQRRQERMGA